jgi:serine phosphatase RsbU (regulator of sigma subunit)/Tfp pilus assembly protein PilF
MAQTNNLAEKLIIKLEAQRDDTSRVRILSDIVDNIYDPAVWSKYNDRALELANMNLPNSDTALAFIFKKYKGYALNNKALEIETAGNRVLALEYYQQSLALHRSNKWKKGVSSSLNNIGSLLYDQGEYELAINYYNESIAIKKELGYQRGLAWTYLNLGSLEEKLHRLDSALVYYNKAYDIHKNNNDIYGMGAAAHNIGTVLGSTSGNRALALEKYRESLRCYEQVADSTGISWEMGVIGLELFSQGQTDSALFYTHKSLLIAQNSDYKEGISASAGHLTEVYQALGDYENAFNYQLVQNAVEDSLQNNKIQQEILKTEMQFVHSQEKLELEKERLKRELVSEAKQKQQQQIIISVLVGLFVVTGFLVLLFQRFKREKLQKLKIEKQRDEIEGKNVEIIDSITYAKRIQQAILKIEDQESTHLPSHFIFFKPKDIVSGDFYWIKEVDNVLYLSVADCTGHGVSGALLSMLGVSLLNDIVNDHDGISPAEILGKLRGRIIKELSQSEKEEDSRDGMDISLLKLNLKTRKAEWSGANNPLWIIRRGKNEMEEIKPDKQPIAYYPQMEPFTHHEVQLDKGDSFYLFSDGYPDQFGGLKGKKLKYKPFKQLLLKNVGEEVEMQELLLSKYFENWKGELQQIDDVCVLGVKL